MSVMSVIPTEPGVGIWCWPSQAQILASHTCSLNVSCINLSLSPIDSVLTVSLIGPLLLFPEAITLAFTALCWGPCWSLLPVSLNLPTLGHAAQCTLVRWLSSSRIKCFLVHLVNDDWFCKLFSRVVCNLSFLHVSFVFQLETHFFVWSVSSCFPKHGSHLHLCTGWVSGLGILLWTHFLTNPSPMRLSASHTSIFSRKASPESHSYSLISLPRASTAFFVCFGYLDAEYCSILIC